MRVALSVVCVCALSMPTLAQTTAPPITLDAVLSKAGTYVEDYQQRLSTVVAEEEYVQRDQTPRRRNAITGAVREPIRSRTLRADVLLVRPDASRQWLQFRDVFEVDGSPVRDRDDRLARLFLEPNSSSLAQAAAILEESARFNIGTVLRTINMPVLALAVLVQGNQDRFAFSRTDTGDLRAFEGLAAPADIWTVEYRETGAGTLVRGSNGRDLPVRGRFWIDATTGAVLRSEMVVDDGETRGRIEVMYQREPPLDFLVPVEMREDHTSANGTRVYGTATYSRFRRFGVTVDETIAPPPC